jgi:hypothetical protein
LLRPFNTRGQDLRTGQQVEVNYNGHWYKSTILQVNGDKYKVHYDGYPSSDDTWVLRSFIRVLNTDGEPEKVNCDFNAPAGSYTKSSGPTEKLFKKELYDWYRATATGEASSPSAIGISYKSFIMKPAYKNTVSNVPGRGAVRRHSGAPVNAMVYMVHATYFVCEQYNSGVAQKQVTADFSFFINAVGEWTCSKDS